MVGAVHRGRTDELDGSGGKNLTVSVQEEATHATPTYAREGAFRSGALDASKG